MTSAAQSSLQGAEQAAVREEVASLTSRQLAGQLLVVGFDGQTEAPAALVEKLKAKERAGVILFRRNIGKGLDGLNAVARLNQTFANACPSGFSPLVAVDEEGGRVARLFAPALKMPPMRRLAEHGGALLVERVAEVVGLQLAALGFSMNFAPVADVDTNPDNPIVGDRAFSREPEQIVSFAQAYCLGLARGGIQHCLKHFPGHGDTLLDSHLALPRVERDRAGLDCIELLPFRRLVEGADSVMTAHVVFPSLFSDDEQSQLPATLRPRVVRHLLRDEFGFAGVVFSDDLEMKALAEQGPPGEVGVRAVEAGCDILLVCSDVPMQDEVFDALLLALEQRPGFRGHALASAARSLQLRRRNVPNAATPSQLQELLVAHVEPLQQDLNALL